MIFTLQALQHKLALEANRVGELEGLLSGMRTNQFKSTFSEQHSADKAGSLQARNTLLTQQASWSLPQHSPQTEATVLPSAVLCRCKSVCLVDGGMYEKDPAKWALQDSITKASVTLSESGRWSKQLVLSNLSRTCL